MSFKDKTLEVEKSDEGDVDERSTLMHLADHIYRKIEPHIGNNELEVEVRLCSHQVPIMELQQPYTILSKQFGPQPGKIKVGVTKEGFEAIKNYLIATKTDTDHPPLMTTTEDVKVNNERYSYDLINSDTGPIRKLTSVIIKQRILFVDVAINREDINYDFRFSINTESPVSIPATSPTKKMYSYTRFKKRISIKDGLFLYDLTEIRTSSEDLSYEIEIEGCFERENPKEDLTREWLVELMQRILSLAAIASK
ncbi:unnamed protein product [Phytomonas sp. Hart1]|nr:unnamed protein product [Phytomonas sp. Hart1]|eukprot:CCW71004.1 unnamed protein product [Phytomonas sp. isolate Hart1]